MKNDSKLLANIVYVILFLTYWLIVIFNEMFLLYISVLDKENICFWIRVHTWKRRIIKVTTQKKKKKNLRRNRVLINPITYDNTNFDRFPDNVK